MAKKWMFDKYFEIFLTYLKAEMSLDNYLRPPEGTSRNYKQKSLIMNLLVCEIQDK